MVDEGIDMGFYAPQFIGTVRIVSMLHLQRSLNNAVD